jgi:hypothetical protein
VRCIMVDLAVFFDAFPLRDMPDVLKTVIECLTEVVSTPRQGLTLVHFQAQPEPFLVTEATARVRFSAQPETFLSLSSPNIARSSHV